jgi:NTP pyrophosphatase (non-canonical NTP hydrolase)
MGSGTVSETLRHIEALAAVLPAAQRSAHAYAQRIDLFSGADEVAAAHPAGRAYVAATRMALLQSEVSEALQEIRSRDLDLDPAARRPHDALSLELADILIRTLELSEYLGVDLGAALVHKTADTLSGYRHGGVRF